MIVVRYADDIVVGFEHGTDAHRFLERCCAAAGVPLALHPDKTRLIEFGRSGGRARPARGRQAGDLRLPGLHLVCGRSRRGRF